MRLDKYLKVSRLIKRRTIANEACDAGKILVNDKVAKAGTKINENDIIQIQFGNNITRVQVLVVKEHVRKEETGDMYKAI